MAGYALPTRAWFSGMTGSARLPVGGVPAAPAAVLLQLDPVGVVPLVLPGGVVAVLADGTGQGDGGPDVGGRHGSSLLLEDFDGAAGADGAAAFADGEAQPLSHGDGLDQLDRHLGGITRLRNHGPLGQG